LRLPANYQENQTKQESQAPRVRTEFPDCNRARIEIDPGYSGFIVWSDTFMAGWKAFKKGNLDTSAGRVNHFLKGVILNPEDSIIEWIYQPNSSVTGIYLTLLTLLFLPLMFIIFR
jgi:hypothetical protein